MSRPTPGSAQPCVTLSAACNCLVSEQVVVVVFANTHISGSCLTLPDNARQHSETVTQALPVSGWHHLCAVGGSPEQGLSAALAETLGALERRRRRRRQVARRDAAAFPAAHERGADVRPRSRTAGLSTAAAAAFAAAPVRLLHAQLVAGDDGDCGRCGGGDSCI